MFTGIIKCLGKITSIQSSGTNKIFFIESNISGKLKIDESVNHNGVCLTIEKIKKHTHRVTAIQETLDKTNIGNWAVGEIINLERAMKLNGMLDGHIVQGHVDATATCTEKKELNGSFEFTFQFDEKFGPLVIEKGSICLNGVSLTCFNVTINNFTVAIIPYTFKHTNFSNILAGSKVNVEFDIIGKYVCRLAALSGVQ